MNVGFFKKFWRGRADEALDVRSCSAKEHKHPRQMVWMTSRHMDSKSMPIVLIHDNSAPASVWSKGFIDLKDKEGEPVVAFDLPGHGQSFYAAEGDEELYTVGNFVHVLDKVLEHYKLKQRDYLIVASGYGASIAMAALSQGVLSKARGIISLGAEPVGKKIPQSNNQLKDADIKNTVSKKIHWNSAFEGNDAENLALAMYRACSMDNAFNDKQVPDSFVESVASTDGRVRHEVYQSYLNNEIANEHDIMKNNSTMPYYFVWGDNDPFVSAASMRSTVREFEADSSLNVSHMLVPDAGHALLSTNPRDVNTMIHRFSTRLSTKNPEVKAASIPSPE